MDVLSCQAGCGRLAAVHLLPLGEDRPANLCEFCTSSPTRHPRTEDEEDMTEQVYDYSGFGDEAPSADGDLAALSNLAEQQRHHEDEVERLQVELKKAQNLLKDVAEFKIPELMDKVGMSKFSTKNGLNIAIKESIRASMGAGPAKERNLDWLEQNGHEVVIKMSVEVPFGKSDEDRATAKALADRLRKDGLPASFARKVEPATLSALARELLEEGREFPEEQFGVFRQRTSKIS